MTIEDDWEDPRGIADRDKDESDKSGFGEECGAEKGHYEQDQGHHYAVDEAPCWGVWEFWKFGI